MPEKAKDAQDKVRDLQIKLYLAAKRSRNRRFHALYIQSDAGTYLSGRWGSGFSERACREVNGVGEPDEGEPHVRFCGGTLETGID